MSRRSTAAMSGPVPEAAPGTGADALTEEAMPAGALPASTCPASALAYGEVPPSRASSPSVSRAGGASWCAGRVVVERVGGVLRCHVLVLSLGGCSDLNLITSASVKSTYLVGII